jgi:chaperonin GroEL
MTHLLDAVNLFTEIAQKNRPVLVLTSDLKKEAAKVLQEVSARGRLRVCVVKIPLFGIKNELWLEDLAMMTGTKVIDEELGMPLSAVTIKDLGFARQVSVGISTTKIIASKRDEPAIEKRIAIYKNDLEKLIGERERIDVRNRVSFLSSKAAVITVGYSTELELREKGDRVEDAMCAVRAAKEEGFVPGGGMALLRIAKKIDLSLLKERYRLGAETLIKACSKPAIQILLNAGEDPEKILSEILQKDDVDYGYNVATEEFGQLSQMGIIDPKKVTRAALQNATTISLLLITTEAAIADKREDPSAWQPPAGWRPPSNSNLNHKY